MHTLCRELRGISIVAAICPKLTGSLHDARKSRTIAARCTAGTVNNPALSLEHAKNISFQPF
jgi:hypothetical protein